jgi:hypothetical protein
MSNVVRLLSAGTTAQIQLRIELLEMKPAVWRRVIVPACLPPECGRV